MRRLFDWGNFGSEMAFFLAGIGIGIQFYNQILGFLVWIVGMIFFILINLIAQRKK